MPDIKNQFTGGKMNKDVDERLVPNGEYRDAMNIQVSTSEGSDVGTVQNILGNKLVDGLDFLGPEATCVGAIADEKNDALYWFIAQPLPIELQIEGPLGPLSGESDGLLFSTVSDYILEYKEGQINVVFTDLYYKAGYSTVLPTGVLNTGVSIPMVAHEFVVGDIITSFSFESTFFSGLEIEVTATTATHITISTDNITVDILAILMGSSYTKFTSHAVKVLNFNPSNTITGINIIDDMLFWVDGYHDNNNNLQGSEPKKINISRSIVGTNQSGLQHTLLINPAQNITTSSGIKIKEEHITVIRRAPLKPPFLKMGLVGGETSGISENGSAVFSGAAVGDVISIVVADIGSGPIDIKVGGVLRLSGYPDELPDNWDIRVKIVSSTYASLSTTYVVKVESITPGADLTHLDWYIELESIDFIFERKLPRFAYRYKYEDNEYSSFSPFTQVAFTPGQFNYEPIKAYNTGMTNRIKSLTIMDFVPEDIPLDVVKIDILYKNEINPSVYLLKSVFPTEGSWQSNGSVNSPGASKGSYAVSSENISSAIPSSQLLRSWDNVPQKALAQEITGNRIVYGNYAHGYDAVSPQITASLDNRLIDLGANKGEKSIKSLRSYDIGVVWGDKYGRETPVKTSGSSVWVPKAESLTSNYLKASLESSPGWADYYRFYVKETSNEYYNLAVDRVYDAGDGNKWVSFPSVDRNKVDEDTYLILKKGFESSELIPEEARYKIVAIENEAPEYIKTTFERLARTNTDDSRPTFSCNMFAGSNNAPCSIPTGGRNAPTVGMKGFSINSSLWLREHSVISPIGMQLTSPKTLLTEVSGNTSGSTTDELYVSFSKETTASGVTNVKPSRKYHVVDISDSEVASDLTGFFYINLDTPIVSEDEWVTEGTSSSQDDNIHIHFWKKTIINKPEFDGRFFVKILGDSTIDTHLILEKSIFNNLMVVATTNLYKIEDADIGNFTEGDTYSFNQNYTPESAPAGVTTNSSGEWNTKLKFGGSSATSNWFIDKATFASKQNGSQILPSTGKLSYDNVTSMFSDGTLGITNHHSCDISSTQNQSFAGPCHLLGTVSYDLSAFYSWINWGGAVPNEDIGDGKSNGQVAMKGAHQHAGDNYIDISYAQLGPNGATGNTTDYKLDWRVGEDGNSSTDQEKLVVGQLKLGTRFRLKGSDVVYKILGVNKFRLFNYQGARTARGPKHFAGLCGSNFWNTLQSPQTTAMADKRNRRLTYRIRYEVDTLFTPDSSPVTAIDYAGEPYNYIDNTSSRALEFLADFTGEGENPISSDPAIFETEPKEEVDIDIYYEASSSIPTLPITNENIHLLAPIGSTLVPPSVSGSGIVFPEGVFVTSWDNINPSDTSYTLSLSTPITINQFNFLSGQLNSYIEKDNGELVSFNTASGITEQVETFPGSGVYETMIVALTVEFSNEIGLNWFNCWSFNNGVESNRIGDTYNKPYLSNGVIASSSTEELEEREHRKHGLIYSGIYNSTSGVNNLNQFIAAEKITKDINPIYGSIQKLHAGWGQGGDLIALCEDRVLKILANKDALYNADGNVNITSTNNVLGQATPYSGEYGISKNPESFASEAYRVYFTDKVRGTVMRLSMDGLTPISSHGMKDWFRDNLKLNNTILGSYDDKKDEYNVTLNQTTEGVSKTVSFREDVKGWVSFKSFTPENAISCANEYYTFKDGGIWKHHDESVPRNTFYNEGKSNSTLNVILNALPGSVKSFNTINYEGSDSRVVASLEDNQYYNLTSNTGWYVDSIFTNKESGSLEEFIEKEGKWFNYIRGKDVQHTLNEGSGITNIFMNSDGSSSFDQASFAIQGLGILGGAPVASPVSGCTNPAMFNYNSNATIDDGSCIAFIYGCKQASASNTCNGCNTDDGSCIWYGCTCDVGSYPYGCTNATPFAEAHAYNGGTTTIDDGSCIAVTSGCTDPLASNYNGAATVDDGSCIILVNGCTEASADANYDSTATVDDGTCIWYGCLDVNATNYQLNFDGAATGYTPASTTYGMLHNQISCTYAAGCTDPLALNTDPFASSDDGTCNYCNWYPQGEGNSNHIYTASAVDQSSPGVNNGSISVTIANTVPHTIANVELFKQGGFNANIALISGQTAAGFMNLAPGDYDVRVTSSPITTNIGTTVCVWDGSVDGGQVHTVGAAQVGIPGCIDPLACNYCLNCVSTPSMCDYSSCIGCMDSTACNYDPLATIDSGSCVLPDGCTDSTAINYDPLATCDDGSCIAIVYGCMDGRQNNGLSGFAATNYAGTGNTLGANGTEQTPVANTNETSALISTNPCTYNTSASTIGASSVGDGNPYGNFLGHDVTLENWTVKINGSSTKHSAWAVYDVSALPLIQWPGYNADGITMNMFPSNSAATSGTRFSYKTARNSTCQGDLNVFWGGNHQASGDFGFKWYYSNDNGVNWIDGSSWSTGTAVELVRFNRYISNTCTSSLINWTSYPNGYNGKFKQNAKFNFLEWDWNNGLTSATEQPQEITQYSESKTVKTGCKFNGYCNSSGWYGNPAGANFPTGANNPCSGIQDCTDSTCNNYNPTAGCMQVPNNNCTGCYAI